MKTYVDIIRELREDRDLTQKEVAQYLGTTQQVYSRYENGENELPVRHLIALCRYYHAVKPNKWKLIPVLFRYIQF